jgi:hypothetical protein
MKDTEDIWNMSKATSGAGRGTPLKDAAKQREAEIAKEISNEMGQFTKKSLDEFLAIKKSGNITPTRTPDNIERRVTEDPPLIRPIDNTEDLVRGSLCCGCF